MGLNGAETEDKSLDMQICIAEIDDEYGIKIFPQKFDDKVLRQILKCVITKSKKRVKVVFVGGLEAEQSLN